MVIHGDLFQRLVDKIIKDIGYNINIIDTDGVIVASGNMSRIGTFHKIGYEAAKKQKRIDIDSSGLGSMNGVKPGINQPFYHEDNLMGVIGITGNPKEIEDLVNIVKSMIELMYDQEVLKQKIYYRQSNKAYFFNELLNAKDEEDLTAIESWAEKLGYTMNIPRYMAIIQIGKRKEGATLSREDIKQGIVEKLTEVGLIGKNDLATFLSSSRLVVLKEAQGKYMLTDQFQDNPWSTKVAATIEAYFPIDFFIATGTTYDEILSLKESYLEADFVTKQLLLTEDMHVGNIHQYLRRYLSHKVPVEIMQHFFEETYLKLVENQEYLDTLVVLMENGGNILLTAQKLFVHRNTVMFRLNKIKEILGFDHDLSIEQNKYLEMLASYITVRN